MMERIKINNKWDNQLGKQLLVIRNLLSNISEDTIDIDLSALSYHPPLISVFFSQFISAHSDFNYILPNNSYLETLRFPAGLYISENELDNSLSYYRNRSYLPLIRFSTSSLEGPTVFRNNLISHIGKMIRSITDISTNYYSAISYFLSELTDNIIEHSNIDEGWISFQYYETYGYMDICIADAGIGVLGAYNNYDGRQDFSHISTHLDAVDNMIKGVSTKELTDQERGFGVHTSREMLVSGLNGSFIFLSGNALLNNYDLIDFGASYSGTLALLRIPVQQNLEFSVYHYTE